MAKTILKTRNAAGTGGTVKTKSKSKSDSKSALTDAQLKEIHNLMVKARALEDRIVKMSKSGEGFFWIGGPGEEAFSIPLGLLVKKGHGLDHDFMHFHYRASGTVLAMGGEMIDTIRQMKNVATDPYSGGRNFVNHYSKKEWNIVPVSSCIEPQYTQSIGTAYAQRNHKGISIVTGGDAGTAEGDFATALVWASRPAAPLPLLMIVTNNAMGISTSWDGQHGEENVSDRGKAFGIKTRLIDGNNVEESYAALKEAMDYVRTERKPFLLEAKVSRLNGHSSASGANRTDDEDPITVFEEKLLKRKILTKNEIESIHDNWTKHASDALKQVRTEPAPEHNSIYDHVFKEENGDKGRDLLAESMGVDFTKNMGEK